MAAKPELMLSRAVLAKVEHANMIEGCVLWWTAGSAIAHEINESDTRLESLGFEEAAPSGLSIWEGDYVYEPADQCTLPVGTFRAPTAMEALAICAGRNPFEAAPLATFIEPIAAGLRARVAELEAMALRYASEEPPTQPFERPAPPDVNEEIVIDDPTAPTPDEESR